VSWDLTLVVLQDLDAIYQRCHDPALSVRKQALVSLTTLLQEMPHNVQLQRLVKHDWSLHINSGMAVCFPEKSRWCLIEHIHRGIK